MTTMLPFIGVAADLPSFRHRRFRTLARLTSVLLWLPRFWKVRRQMAALVAMSEHERRDIGLTACDVENALALPVDRDPTEMLARVASDRCRRAGY